MVPSTKQESSWITFTIDKVANGMDRIINIWDMDIKLICHVQYDSSCHSVCLSPIDNTVIISGHDKGIIERWHSRTGITHSLHSVSYDTILHLAYHLYWLDEKLAYKILKHQGRIPRHQVYNGNINYTN